MFDLPGHEAINICFQSTDSEYKSVSIDMWPDSAAAIKSLASKSDVYELHSALVQAATKATDIARQEKFQEDRQRIHTEIIMQNEDTVKKYGIAKIVIVVLLAGIQIVVFKSLFKNDNRLSIWFGVYVLHINQFGFIIVDSSINYIRFKAWTSQSEPQQPSIDTFLMHPWHLNPAHLDVNVIIRYNFGQLFGKFLDIATNLSHNRSLDVPLIPVPDIHWEVAWDGALHIERQLLQSAQRRRVWWWNIDFTVMEFVFEGLWGFG